MVRLKPLEKTGNLQKVTDHAAHGVVQTESDPVVTLKNGDVTVPGRSRVLGQVPTASSETSPIDASMGVHLLKVLDRQTLSGNAANAKHAAQMERAAAIIGGIERMPGRLGSIASFKPKQAFNLYEHLFPNPDEREPIADIKARLKTYDTGAKPDGGGFHALAITDKDRNVIGYTQGSTVPTDDGVFYYWQYGGVADKAYMKDTYGKDMNPREHGVLNAIHGINAATLQATADQVGKPQLGMVWESEPRGLGEDPESIAFTGLRLSIHNKAGGRVMMGQTADGELVNIHLQPRLTEDSEPIALHMMYRPLKYEEGDENKKGELNKPDATAMMMAWVNNFRVEGFAEVDVAEAEREISGRLARCEKIVLLPANEVPDAITLAATDPIMKQQIFDMYGVDTLEAARAFYSDAMKAS